MRCLSLATDEKPARRLEVAALHGVKSLNWDHLVGVTQLLGYYPERALTGTVADVAKHFVQEVFSDMSTDGLDSSVADRVVAPQADESIHEQNEELTGNVLEAIEKRDTIKDIHKAVEGTDGTDSRAKAVLEKTPKGLSVQAAPKQPSASSGASVVASSSIALAPQPPASNKGPALAVALDPIESQRMGVIDIEIARTVMPDAKWSTLVVKDGQCWLARFFFEKLLPPKSHTCTGGGDNSPGGSARRFEVGMGCSLRHGSRRVPTRPRVDLDSTCHTYLMALEYNPARGGATQQLVGGIRRRPCTVGNLEWGQRSINTGSSRLCGSDSGGQVIHCPGRSAWHDENTLIC